MVKDHINLVENLSKKVRFYRIITFILVFLLLVAATGLWSHGHKRLKYFSPKNFPLLDPARAFLPSESYIINIQSLRDYLHGLEIQYPDSISIYYEQINSGANISINKDLRLFPASLSKLVQAILITKKVEEGKLTWDKKLKTQPSDLSSDSGDLYKTIGDRELSVEELISELLVHSDNTAQNIFSHYLEVADYLEFQDETGLQDLYNEHGFISAKEYTRILRVLYASSFLKSENSEKILEYLSKATFSDFLSQGIPSDIKFAHKYGQNGEHRVFIDSGIVYIPKKPYMITVMIKSKDLSDESIKKVKSLMKEISVQAYNSSK